MEKDIKRKELRQAIRSNGIKARDSLAVETRKEYSAQIVDRIVNLPEFAKAKTVMIYKSVRGEVNLRGLEPVAEAMGKTLVYPLCINKTEMLGLHPNTDDGWKAGSFGIMEPVREASTLIEPGDIDLVICPCTVFDEKCNRMGMGAGYYDRYLSKCTNAHIVLVAFEAQKVDDLPTDPWDKPMEKAITEKAVYVR